MKYFEKLNAERSTDRKIFFIGMVLALIGYFIPVFFDEDGLYNVFTGASAYNIPGYAYLATFLVVGWLASIAGIALFFITHTIVGDVVVWLIGCGFGIAELVSLFLYYEELPFLHMSAGAYVIIVGWIVALVGTVLGAAHIKAPQA